VPVDLDWALIPFAQKSPFLGAIASRLSAKTVQLNGIIFYENDLIFVTQRAGDWPRDAIAPEFKSPVSIEPMLY
jgi:hypothetical protein